MTRREKRSGSTIGTATVWLLILAMTAVAAGFGYVASLRKPTVYRATTSLLVGQPFQTPTIDRDDFEAAEQLALTYADVIQRQPVLQGVVDTLGLDMTWEGLSRQIQVDVPSTNPHLISIVVEARTPSQATAIATEIGSEAIALSPTESETQEAADTDDFLRSRLETLQSEIQKAQTQIEFLESTLTTESPAASVMTQLQDQQRLLIDLQGNYASLLDILMVRELPNYLEVLEAPGSEATRNQPNSAFVAFLAGGIGFLLAIGLVYLLELRQRRDGAGEGVSLVPLQPPSPPSRQNAEEESY